MLRFLDELIMNLINFFPICAWYWMISALIINIDQRETVLLRYGIFLLIPVLGGYMIRRFTESSLLFGLGQIILFGLTMLFRPDSEVDMVFNVMVVVLIMAYSFIIRAKKMKESGISPVAGGIFIVGAYLLVIMTHHVVLDAYYWIMILFVLFSMVHKYLTQYFWFVETRKSVNEDMPAEEILKSGVKYTGIFMGISTVIMFMISQYASIEILAEKLAMAWHRFMRWLFSHLSWEEPEEMISDRGQQSGMGGLEYLMDRGNENLWLKHLFDILWWIAVVVASVALILFLCWMIKTFYQALEKRRLKEKNSEKESQQVIVEKIRHKTTNESKIKSEREHLIFLTPEEKIRKIYKNAVKKADKQDLLRTGKFYEDPSKTVGELLQHFSKEQFEAAAELTALYEKARYVKKVCTQADVQRAKELSGLL